MTQQQTIPAELVERMVAHFRKSAEHFGDNQPAPSKPGFARDMWDEFNAIVAALPKPVDPDLIAAREIVALTMEIALCNGKAEAARQGALDSSTPVQRALSAIKAAREQGRGA